MFSINEVIDRPRRCGWRKQGGYYFVSDREDIISCPVLPIEMGKFCEHCGHEYRFSRAWQWSTGVLIRKNGDFSACDTCRLPEDRKKNCALAIEPWIRIGLVWVGTIHYRTAASFSAEALAMGISRRLHMPPRNFISGETPVAFAHSRLANPSEPGIYSAAIILVSLPRVEYVVRDSDTREKLQKIADRGIRLVRVLKQQTSIEDFFGEKTDEITAN